VLIEFGVSNYRSIRERQVLSMVASADKSLPGNAVLTEAVGPVLRAAVIFGANASGKTNVLRALRTLQVLVLGSASSQQGQALPVQPFLLDKESAARPTEFDLTFLVDGTRFEYHCAVDAVRVHKEWLVAYPHSKPARWFEREYHAALGTYEWYFGSRFEADKAARQVMQDFTRPNALFLATAVQLNNEQLRPVFAWIADRLIVRVHDNQLNPFLSIEMLKSEEGRSRVAKYLQAADLGIARIEMREEEVAASALPFSAANIFFAGTGANAQGVAPADRRGMPLFPGDPGGVSAPARFFRPRVTTFHLRSDTTQEVPMDMDDESDGTRQLFAFIGGWARAIESGATLVIDELDKSLHPHITKFLLTLFNGRQNERNAQLVFSTHDTTLLDKEILRRDQVWFTEKDQNQGTRLYPLLEFKPRKGEDLDAGYLRGRYGATPIVDGVPWSMWE
jgi:hypothetical protein